MLRPKTQLPVEEDVCPQVSAPRPDECPRGALLRRPASIPQLLGKTRTSPWI